MKKGHNLKLYYNIYIYYICKAQNSINFYVLIDKLTKRNIRKKIKNKINKIERKLLNLTYLNYKIHNERCWIYNNNNNNKLIKLSK